MNRFIQGMVAAGALVTASVVPALAGNVTLVLTRTNLTDVPDAAGRWQYDTGTVARGSNAAGQYEIERRVSTGGTETQNSAAERITFFLFSAADRAPETIVVEGAYSYTSGVLNGSVAAASSRYAYMRGADVTGVVSGLNIVNVTITWLGVFPFGVP